MAGEISRGFLAGLSAGGRGSGVSAGLKEVLKGLRQTQDTQAGIGVAQMQQQGAMARTMLGEGINPMTGGALNYPSLPQGMEEAGYINYRGKPYKTRSIVDQTPGEKEAMSMAYMNFIYKQLAETDPQAASEFKVKMLDQRRSMAAGLLGSDFESPESPTEQPNFLQRMLGGAGNLIKKYAGV